MMAGGLPHLPLRKHPGSARRKRPGFGYKRAHRNARRFYERQAGNLDSIMRSYESDQKRYGRYLDPILIFKMVLGYGVSDDAFRKDLRRAGIEVLSSPPDRTGYWVAFADGGQLDGFKEKLRRRGLRDVPTFVDAIDEIGEISREEKIGAMLRANPIGEGESAHIDVEIWMMEDSRMGRFMEGFGDLVAGHRGEVVDEMPTRNFHVVRLKAGRALFEEVVGLREVSSVERPPSFRIERQLGADIKDLDVGGPPPAGRPGILIVDSGIRYHPLLEPAVADRIVLPTPDGRISEVRSEDDVGHGTRVAGVALYGDVGRCADSAAFDPPLWLYSAKVLYRASEGDVIFDGLAVFDEKELPERQLGDAVKRTVEKHENCRVVNISFGDAKKTMHEGGRQFRLASLIDELSARYPKILFTVAAGNNTEDLEGAGTYPEYLASGAPGLRIIDPATSAHAISVGSIAHSDSKTLPAGSPSPFTRVGPGLGGMIKPDLVEFGGGYSSDLVTVNPNHDSEGRLFTLDKGTSLAAPKVAHDLAVMTNSMPQASRSLIKALILSSASIPKQRPGPLGGIGTSGSNREAMKLFNIYGHGRPAVDDALHSDPNRVLLVHDGTIRPDRVDYFPIMLPDEFVNVGGRKSISVSLAFDPPVDRNRADYMGVTMGARLFKNSSMRDVRAVAGREMKGDADAGELRRAVIRMSPGIKIRRLGAHQKAVAEWSGRPGIDTSKPIILAVTSYKKWCPKDHAQSYGVVVTLKHEGMNDLYGMINMRNHPRTMA